MRGENWKEIQENRKWENKYGWRFLCNSQLYFFWKQLNGDNNNNNNNNKTNI